MDRLPFYLGGSPDPDVYQGSFQLQQNGYGVYFDDQSQQDSFSPFPYFDHNAFLQQQHQQQFLAQQQFFYQQAAFFNGGGRGTEGGGGTFLAPMEQQAAMQEMMGNIQSHQQRRTQQYQTLLAAAQSSRGGRGGGKVGGGPKGRKGTSAGPSRPSPSSLKPNSSSELNPNPPLDRELDPSGTHPLRPKINTNVSLNSEASSSSSSPLYPPPSNMKRAYGTPIYDFTNPSPTPIADSLRIYGLPPSQDPQRLYGDHREIAVLERSGLVRLLTAWGEKIGSLLGVDALSEQERFDAPHPGAVALIEAFWEIGGAWDWQDELRTDTVCRSIATKATMPPKVVKVVFEKWRTLRTCIGEGRGGGIGESSEEVEEMSTKRRKVEVEDDSRMDTMESDDEIEDILVATEVSTSLNPSTTSILELPSSPSQHTHSHSSTPSKQLDSYLPSTSNSNPSNLPQHLSPRSSTSPPKQRLSDLLPLGHTDTDPSELSPEDETDKFFSSLVLPVEEAEASTTSSSSSLPSNLASTSSSTSTFAHIRTTIKQSANSTNERIRERLDRIRQSSVTSNASASSRPPSPLPTPSVPLADSQAPPHPSSSLLSHHANRLASSETTPVLPPSQPSKFNAIDPNPAPLPPSSIAVVVAHPQTQPFHSHPPASIQNTASCPLQPDSSPTSTSTPSRPPPRQEVVQSAFASSSSSSKAITNGFASSSKRGGSSSNNDWRPSEYGTSPPARFRPWLAERTRSTYTDLLVLFPRALPPLSSSSRPRPPHLDLPCPPASQHQPQHDITNLNATNGNALRQPAFSSDSGTRTEMTREEGERGSVARVVEEKKKVEGETRSLPLGWEAKFSKTKQATWYYHRPSKATSWTFPST